MKKKHNTDEFILQNRDLFEEELPREMQWDFFENHHLEILRSTQKVVSMRTFGLFAAAVALVFSAMVVFHFYIVDEMKRGQTTADKSVSVEKLALDEDFLQAESYYKLQISSSRKQLKSLIDKKEFEDTESELKYLEKEYKMLQKDLKRGVNPKIIADAMLENLKLRYEILNSHIEAVEAVKQKLNQDETKTEQHSEGI